MSSSWRTGLNRPRFAARANAGRQCMITPLLIVVVTTSAMFQAKQRSDCCTSLVCSCKRSSNNRATIKVVDTSISSAACHIFRFFMHPDCIDIHIARLNMLKVMGMWWCILIALDLEYSRQSHVPWEKWVRGKDTFRRSPTKVLQGLQRNGLANFLNMEWIWNATGTVWTCIFGRVSCHHVMAHASSNMSCKCEYCYYWRCSKRGHRRL